MPRCLPSGVQGLVLTPCERRFANAIRAVTRGADVLYHGTRYAIHILRSGKLNYSRVGTTGVSFTRLPEVAVFSALLPRIDVRSEPAVLIIDRVALRSRYRVEPHHDRWKGHGDCERDEAEEIVWRQDVCDLELHLVGTFLAGMVTPRPLCRVCLDPRWGVARDVACEELAVPCSAANGAVSVSSR